VQKAVLRDGAVRKSRKLRLKVLQPAEQKLELNQNVCTAAHTCAAQLHLLSLSEQRVMRL